MATTAGLSRRRVQNASSGSVLPNDEDGASPTTPTGNGGGVPNHSPIHSVSHAGTAFEGGSKIAYDPRDLENADEDRRQGGSAPKLTIMEEVLLLGLKDKQVGSSSCRGLVLRRGASPTHLPATYDERARSQAYHASTAS